MPFSSVLITTSSTPNGDEYASLVKMHASTGLSASIAVFNSTAPPPASKIPQTKAFKPHRQTRLEQVRTDGARCPHQDQERGRTIAHLPSFLSGGHLLLCAINIDCVNTLACLCRIEKAADSKIHPLRLPHTYVVKHLFPGLTRLYKQHHSIKPYFQSDIAPKETVHLQTSVVRGAPQARRPVQVHPLRMIFDLLSLGLVELGQVPWARPRW
ncbi:unnamed protein product [Tilletia controversa]|nr:unnamed protein product [Tilletia caries]CAD6951272.1 unnamed protein product [Tilletia controversa]